MTESDKSFEAYMSEEITYAGMTGKRCVIWSITRCVLAHQVWDDCMERQNVTRDSERDKQHGPSCT